MLDDGAEGRMCIKQDFRDCHPLAVGAGGARAVSPPVVEATGTADAGSNAGELLASPR